VALGAVRTEHTGMIGRVGMTVYAGRGQAGVHARHFMAADALQPGMAACQREDSMVEIGGQPA